MPLDTIEEGDPATGTWKVVGNLPTARGDVACAVAGGKLYVAGGYNDPMGERGTPPRQALLTHIRNSSCWECVGECPGPPRLHLHAFWIVALLAWGPCARRTVTAPCWNYLKGRLSGCTSLGASTAVMCAGSVGLSKGVSALFVPGICRIQSCRAILRPCLGFRVESLPGHCYSCAPGQPQRCS